MRFNPARNQIHTITNVTTTATASHASGTASIHTRQTAVFCKHEMQCVNTFITLPYVIKMLQNLSSLGLYSVCTGTSLVTCMAWVQQQSASRHFCAISRIGKSVRWCTPRRVPVAVSEFTTLWWDRNVCIIIIITTSNNDGIEHFTDTRTHLHSARGDCRPPHDNISKFTSTTHTQRDEMASNRMNK